MQEEYQYLKTIGIRPHDSIIVAVSGGPDSMCLLHLLNRLKQELDVNIICAHVNHNVRSESEDEKVFVRTYCQQNDIIFEYMKILEYGEDNFHNEARSKRYEYFTALALKYGSKYLLTAHHGDDLIETILMRLVRGSSLKGYSGFSKEVKMESYLLVRPLINVSKETILKYCADNKIKYVQDKSNQKDIYTRNRFRKYIVPLLRKEDSKLEEKFMQFSQTLVEYDEYVNKQIMPYMDLLYKDEVLDLVSFNKLEKLPAKKVINNILETIYQDDLMLITSAHVRLIFDLIASSKPNSFIYLPNNIQVVKSYNKLKFIKELVEANSYEVELINLVNLPNGKNIEIVKKSDDNSNNVCRLSSLELVMPLHVRTKKQGDKLTVKGMLGSKKLKDIFIDEKIDLTEREMWPVVVDSEDNIVWVPGLKKTKYEVDKDLNYDIIIKYY